MSQSSVQVRSVLNLLRKMLNLKKNVFFKFFLTIVYIIFKTLFEFWLDIITFSQIFKNTTWGWLALQLVFEFADFWCNYFFAFFWFVQYSPYLKHFIFYWTCISHRHIHGCYIKQTTYFIFAKIIKVL